MTDYTKLTAYAKREERERIIGILEWYASLQGDTVPERYLQRTIAKIIQTIEAPTE